MIKRLLMAALILGALPVLAEDVPNTFTLQGVLRNATGEVINGQYSMIFTLYDAQTGGTVLWKEQHKNVIIENGVYTVVLGTVTPLPMDLFSTHKSVWMGVAIEGQNEFKRIPLATVPFAFHARSANKAQGLECTGCITKDMLAFDFDKEAVTAVENSGKFLSTEGGIITGDLQVSGTVSAAKFVGDGSKLTGIPMPKGNCDAGSFVAGIQDDGTLICKPAASGVTSVDGLKGGTIDGDVTVSGKLTVTGDADVKGKLTVNGADVCTTAGNCGMTLGQLSCNKDQVPMWDGTKWTCGSVLGQLACDKGQALVWDGTKWDCGDMLAAPADKCDKANEALAWDGTKFVCHTISGTGVSGGKAQGFEVKDPWGFVWDGMMRPMATWSEAKATCEAMGARLPTMTELYRVSQAGGNPGGVRLFGPLSTGDYLWTIIKYHQGNHAVVRLSDGDVGYSSDTSKRPYRCVWPNNDNKAFTGNDCFGPPGEECFKLATGKGRYNMDKYDRPPAYYSAAISECMFYHAHVPYSEEYTQAIKAGLPNGTNSWNHVADHVRDRNWGNGWEHVVFKWGGVATGFTGTYYQGYSSWVWDGSRYSEYRFRCVGLNTVPMVSPVKVDNQWTSNYTWQKATSQDQNPANYINAIAHCFSIGAHLTTSRDLYELVKAGLPNGSGAWIWTADKIGYNWNDQYLRLAKWSGIDDGFDPENGNYTTNWSVMTSNQMYRCVWYPIDKEFTGPLPGACTGGCFEVTLANTNPPVKMWADKLDRPATSWAGAAQICYLAGGHLASERDMIELIRAGLPNGTNRWLWTGEIRVEWNSNYAPAVSMVRWSGINTSYTGDFNTWYIRNNNAPFRCVWTNELR